jgi:hypothetical protein
MIFIRLEGKGFTGCGKTGGIKGFELMERQISQAGHGFSRATKSPSPDGFSR